MNKKNARCLARVGFGVGVLVLTAGGVLGGDLPRGRCNLVPESWVPSLEQVQENVEESLAARPNQSQQVLNRSSQDLADLADARLFIAYVSLMQRLDEKERNKLFSEQNQWLAQRAASAHAAVVSKGGSLEALEHTSAFRRVTEKRLAELQSRLSPQSTPGGTSERGGK
jgi:uncharacterized protein YecT (DUF1311 family)